MVESITHLPISVLVEMLSRLPLKSLFACRCTCKTFANLISHNPEFIAAHSSNATGVLVFQLQGPYVDNTLKRRLHLIEPEFDFPCAHRADIPAIHIRHKEVDDNLRLVNSCNGLLYLIREDALKRDSIVCNPVNYELLMIPPVDQWPAFVFGWLGFCPGTKQYKVLNIFMDEECDRKQSKVTVVGSNIWVDVDDTVALDFPSDSNHALLNGVVYWFSMVEIYCFNFEVETFGSISLPFDVEDVEDRYDDYRVCDLLNVGSLGESLCFTFLHPVNPHHRADLWVMERNRNQETWIEQFVVDIPSNRWLMGSSPVQPLQVLKNGEILFLSFDNSLACYDPRTNGFRIVMSDQQPFQMPLHVDSLVPSFVSLKDILNVDEVSINRI